ncbi:heterokaryon incompatibility protein-domain-containing protein [Xylaria venustula]|nr:heterokaryon incompatibility protein-domain-containing protein [Xylaria venustula]
MSTIYRPVSLERKGIRLLRVHPSECFDDVLQCSLLQENLDDAPEYEALSYVWGSLQFTQDILVDAKPFKITENLDCALRYLRHASADRVLWVDALCINRADITERNHQVTLMKEIYSRCAQDLAWLGPNPGTCRAAFGEAGSHEDGNRVAGELLECLQTGLRIFRKILTHDVETLDDMLRRWRNHPRSWTTHPRAQASMLNDRDQSHQWIISHSDQIALMSVFRWAPLWSRIWVMQEISCARRVLLVAGTETLDWDDVATFLRDDNKPHADAFHTSQQQRRIMKEGKYESELMDVLARFQYANAGDPRDIIYGLLGLVSEPHPIAVDYAKSVRALFTEITRTLGMTPVRKSKENAEALPSWVVDFTNERRFALFEDGLESLLFAQRGIFSAGPPSCAIPCDVSADGLLSGRGVILDQITNILDGDFQCSLLHYPRKWMQLYFHDKAPTGERLFRAFWRTLVMDCKSYPMKRLSLEEIEAEEDIFKAFVQSNDIHHLDELIPVSWDMLVRTLSNWICTVSKTGLLLMVNKQSQEGDGLAILDGGKVPCLFAALL